MADLGFIKEPPIYNYDPDGGDVVQLKLDLHDEESLYNSILEAYENVQLGIDTTTWESYSCKELVRVLRQNQVLSENIIRNCMLLTIALFSPKQEGIELDGVDINELTPIEKEEVLNVVNAALF